MDNRGAYRRPPAGCNPGAPSSECIASKLTRTGRSANEHGQHSRRRDAIFAGRGAAGAKTASPGLSPHAAAADHALDQCDLPAGPARQRPADLQRTPGAVLGPALDVRAPLAEPGRYANPRWKTAWRDR